MTIIALIAAAYRNLHEAIAQRRTYRELRELSPAQLKDIGLRLENGCVYSETDTLDSAGELETRRSAQEKSK